MVMIYNEPAETYHASGCIGSHAILKADADYGGSMKAFFMAYIEGKSPYGKKEPDALIEGRATHAVILENRRLDVGFDVEFGVYTPGCNLQKAEGKREAAVFAAQNRKGIKAEVYERIKVQADAIHADPECHAGLTDGKPEVVIRREDPETGLMVQCRFDWLKNDHRRFYDLKTDRTDLTWFHKVALDSGYHRQVAWYADLLAAEEGVPFQAISGFIIASSKILPYSAQMYRFNEERLLKARDQNRETLRLISEAYDHDYWPDRTGGIITI